MRSAAPPGRRGTSRRTVLKLTAALALAGRPGSRVAALAGETQAAASGAPAGPRHGMSAFGDLALPPDFKHFDYVNPNAPKGGRIAFTAPSWGYNQSPVTFNTLNAFVLKGDAPPRMELTFDSLMAPNSDEPDALYGLLAESVTINGDGTVYAFRLRDGARFHDGSPVTAEDVAFSLNLLKEKGHPNISQTIGAMIGAEATRPNEVIITFTPKRARDVPLLVASLPIFSQAYWRDRDFDASTLEPILGSGPYRVGDFVQGRFIEYHRVPDYWGARLPVNVGQHNFDVIRLEFYRDRTASFEAFKKGVLTVREEFVSKTWATEYVFPAVTGGRVAKETIPDRRPSGAQGFFFNLRRPQFADPRVREALDHAFDFEWSNRNLFYGLYQRTQSFFENSPLKAEGPPSREERALLEPFRGEVPEEVFGEPYVPPVSDGSGLDRRLLRRASELLAEAGWHRKDGALRNADGEVFRIEFLDNDSSFERVINPFVRNLHLLGIDARLRIVDPAQFELRLKNFDYDVVTRRYNLSLTPGEGLRQLFGSKAADTPGSDNLAGIRLGVVDSLIDRIIAAETREEMTVAARALDRVLRAERVWVPQWYKPVRTLAVWQMYGRPQRTPRYSLPLETVWWYDAEKAAAIGMATGQ